MTNNIMRKTNMEKWDNPRLFYLNSIIQPQPNTCPECDGDLITSDDQDETLCSSCGLIVSASIEYVAGIRIVLPYGRH